MSLFSKAADLFFVPKCAFCGKIIGEGGICGDCERALPYLSGKVRGGEFYSACAAALRYEGIVRTSLHRFKFAGKRSYSAEYARLTAEAVRRELEGRYDIVTWVPVSARRLRKRGYDQAHLIAAFTAKRLGVRCVRLLRKTRDNAVQSRINGREKRIANVLGVYRAVNKRAFRDRRVLVIDDIITTGATLSECARTLLMAGAEDVVCAAVASAMGRKHT